MRLAPRALLLAVAVVFAGCRGYGDVSKSVELTERDSGSSIDVKVTDVISVTLRSNQSTPYHWVLTQRPDRSVLETLGSDYESEGDAPGSGGHEIWRFRAVGEGSTALELQYQNLDGTPTGQRFSISVRSQQAG